jgi:hypothetical protein
MTFALTEHIRRVSDSFEPNDSSWQEEPTTTVLFQGASREQLIKAANAYLALPEIVHFYRNTLHEIDPTTGRSPEHYTQGGGCGVYRYFSVNMLM